MPRLQAGPSSAGERRWVTITRTCSIRITTKMFRVTLLVAVFAAALPRSAMADCVLMSVGTVARAADAKFSGRVTSIESSFGGPSAITFTSAVSKALGSSGLTDGVATVFVVGSTAGVTTLEFESGVVHDLDRALEEVAPREGEYRHHLRWNDDNGSSHVRAALVGPSVAIPFTAKRLLLGTWQQIVLLELDTQPRRRQIVIQFVGE